MVDNDFDLEDFDFQAELSSVKVVQAETTYKPAIEGNDGQTERSELDFASELGSVKSIKAEPIYNLATANNCALDEDLEELDFADEFGAIKEIKSEPIYIPEPVATVEVITRTKAIKGDKPSVKKSVVKTPRQKSVLPVESAEAKSRTATQTRVAMLKKAAEEDRLAAEAVRARNMKSTVKKQVATQSMDQDEYASDFETDTPTGALSPSLLPEAKQVQLPAVPSKKVQTTFGIPPVPFGIPPVPPRTIAGADAIKIERMKAAAEADRQAAETAKAKKKTEELATHKRAEEVLIARSEARKKKDEKAGMATSAEAKKREEEEKVKKDKAERKQAQRRQEERANLVAEEKEKKQEKQQKEAERAQAAKERKAMEMKEKKEKEAREKEAERKKKEDEKKAREKQNGEKKKKEKEAEVRKKEETERKKRELEAEEKTRQEKTRQELEAQEQDKAKASGEVSGHREEGASGFSGMTEFDMTGMDDLDAELDAACKVPSIKPVVKRSIQLVKPASIDAETKELADEYDLSDFDDVSLADECEDPEASTAVPFPAGKTKSAAAMNSSNADSTELTAKPKIRSTPPVLDISSPKTVRQTTKTPKSNKSRKTIKKADQQNPTAIQGFAQNKKSSNTRATLSNRSKPLPTSVSGAPPTTSTPLQTPRLTTLTSTTTKTVFGSNSKNKPAKPVPANSTKPDVQQMKQNKPNKPTKPMQSKPLDSTASRRNPKYLAKPSSSVTSTSVECAPNPSIQTSKKSISTKPTKPTKPTNVKVIAPSSALAPQVPSNLKSQLSIPQSKSKSNKKSPYFTPPVSSRSFSHKRDGRSAKKYPATARNSESTHSRATGNRITVPRVKIFAGPARPEEESNDDDYDDDFEDEADQTSTDLSAPNEPSRPQKPSKYDHIPLDQVAAVVNELVTKERRDNVDAFMAFSREYKQPFPKYPHPTSPKSPNLGCEWEFREKDTPDVKLLNIALLYHIQRNYKAAARILGIGTRLFPDDQVFADLLRMNRERGKMFQSQKHHYMEPLRRDVLDVPDAEHAETSEAVESDEKEQRVQDAHNSGKGQWALSATAYQNEDGKQQAETRSYQPKKCGGTQSDAAPQRKPKPEIEIPPSNIHPVVASNPHKLPVVIFATGPPGCGKTLLCSQLAERSNGSIVHFELSALLAGAKKNALGSNRKGLAMVSGSHYIVSVVTDAVREHATCSPEQDKKDSGGDDAGKKSNSKGSKPKSTVGAGGIYLVEGFPRNNKELKIWQHQQTLAHASLNKPQSNVPKRGEQKTVAALWLEPPALYTPTSLVLDCSLSSIKDRLVAAVKKEGKSAADRSAMLKDLNKRFKLHKMNESGVGDVFKADQATQFVNTCEPDSTQQLVSKLLPIIQGLSK